MDATQAINYQILMYVVPIMMAVLAFIGAIGVNALIGMGKNINEIKISIQKITSEHEGLEQMHCDLVKRVEHLEDRKWTHK